MFIHARKVNTEIGKPIFESSVKWDTSKDDLIGVDQDGTYLVIASGKFKLSFDIQRQFDEAQCLKLASCFEKMAKAAKAQMADAPKRS